MTVVSVVGTDVDFCVECIRHWPLALEKLIARLGKMSEAMCVQFAEKPSDRAGDNIFKKKLSQFAGMFQAGVDFLNEEQQMQRCQKPIIILLTGSPRGLH